MADNEPIDDLIAGRMRARYSTVSPSPAVLESLWPSLRRARRRRRAGQAMSGVFAVSAVVFGLIVALPQSSDQPVSVDTAGQPEDDGGGSADRARSEGTVHDVDKALVSPSSTSEPNTEDGPASEADVESATTAPQPTTIAPNTNAPITQESSTTAPTTTVSSAPTTAPSTTTAAPTTTNAPTTTEASVSPGTIESECGVMVVELVGSGIGLVSVDPIAGAEVDVKKSGPEEIEVRLDAGSVHCELNAENRNGQIWSEVELD